MTFDINLSKKDMHGECSYEIEKLKKENLMMENALNLILENCDCKAYFIALKALEKN